MEATATLDIQELKAKHEALRQYQLILVGRLQKTKRVLEDIADKREDHPLFERWNDVHELEDLINDRMWETWNEAKELEWEINGFVAY